MATTLILNGAQSQVINQLDTYNYTVKTAAIHVASITLTTQPASGVSIIIKNNSSTVATFSAPSADETTINLSASIATAVNDVIGFVITSSTAIDKGGNSIKGIINIHVGSSN